MDAFELLAATAQRVRESENAPMGGLFAGANALAPQADVDAGWRLYPNEGEMKDPGWPDSIRRARCTPVALSVVDKDGTAYRGACLGCGWVADKVWRDEGVHYASDRAPGLRFAVEDAHDHSHPGWRKLVPVEKPKALDGYSHAALREWGAKIARLFPAGWFESGGPVLTVRSSQGAMGPQHAGAPGGGWDIAARARVGGQSERIDPVHLLPLPLRENQSYDSSEISRYTYDPEEGRPVSGGEIVERERHRKALEQIDKLEPLLARVEEALDAIDVGETDVIAALEDRKQGIERALATCRRGYPTMGWELRAEDRSVLADPDDEEDMIGYDDEDELDPADLELD
jgi:hypothetical protein